MIFETLSKRTNKELKESLFVNEVFLCNRWGILENTIIQLSTHYIKYIILLSIFAILMFFNLVFWQSMVKGYVLHFIPYWRNLLEWQGIFLSGQLTIIGVVYPLVIGLISILFQNKSSKKVIFPIYQKYSGFMFAGISGITLSGFLIVGYFLRASLDDTLYICFCLTSSMWLFLNLLLTAWFFVKTFRMLDENSRDKIVFRYSINESCVVDVKERIKNVLLSRAVEYHLLKNPDQKILDVLTYDFFGEYTRKITMEVNREKSVKNVKFWLINYALQLQIFILKWKKLQNCKIVINPNRTSMTSKTYNLAEYDGFEINRLVKFLIQISFTYSKNVQHTKIGLTEVLNGFVGPAHDALKDGDTRGFSEARDNLVNWHVEISQALSFINDEGNQDNWLLLSDNPNWLGINYLEEIQSEYIRLAREAVERIPENSSFYRDMLYLQNRVFARRENLLIKEIRSLIQGSYYMWYLLVEWRSYNSESSDIRVSNKYEDILYDFVGAWEYWLNNIEPKSKRKGDLNYAYYAFTIHLEFTASTVISALRFNNYEASGWGIDMLNNWVNNFSRSDYWDEDYNWHSVLINHCLLPLSSDSPIWQEILNDHEYNHNAAYELAFINAQLDLRVITACYLLLKTDDEQQELLAHYVRTLLLGELVHPTGSIGRPLPNISNPGDLLIAFIRQRDYCHGNRESYGAWLSSILVSFGRINEERRVSGRIYSGWGARNIQGIYKAFVEIGIFLSDRRWTLPHKLNDALNTNIFRHMDKDIIISDLRDWIRIAKEDNELILVNHEQQQEKRNTFIESLEDIIQSIEEAQNQTIINAPIDQDRLKRLCVACSNIFLYSNPIPFPLTLFNIINRDADLDESFSFRIIINDYKKEHIAEGLEINRVSNEEYFVNCISNDLKLNVMSNLFNSSFLKTYNYSQINNILSAIRNMSESIDFPVLFVGNDILSRTLHRSIYDNNKSQTFEISHQDGFGDDYICHIGHCEVYRLRFSDVDFNILTSRNLFDTLNFRKLEDNRYVEAEFEQDENNETIGKLNLRYWMKVDLAENIDCIKLEMTTAEDTLESE